MKENNYGGLGFFGALTIAFIVLKLTRIINWSWGWVFAPLWLPVVAAVIIATIIYLYKKHNE